MIFAHTINNVMNQTKTQTRRIVKPGEYIGRQYTPYIDTSIPYAYLPTIFSASGYPKWALGKEYAVQPARTAKAIARIRITRIRLEDVRCISDDDVRAEGFDMFAQFIAVWLKMHDPAAYRYLAPDSKHPSDQFYEAVVGENRKPLMTYLNNSPAERYQAWCLDFELVKPQ